jgi:hypothetical protein
MVNFTRWRVGAETSGLIVLGEGDILHFPSPLFPSRSLWLNICTLAIQSKYNYFLRRDYVEPLIFETQYISIFATT